MRIYFSTIGSILYDADRKLSSSSVTGLKHDAVFSPEAVIKNGEVPLSGNNGKMRPAMNTIEEENRKDGGGGWMEVDAD